MKAGKICAALCAAIMFAGTAFATENVLKFEPIGGGKFIYCNNPEELGREDLADDGDTPEFLMNNSNLTPDRYRIYISHFNRITKNDDSGNTYPGENVYFDVVFTAKRDCTVKVMRTAFEIPENITTYLNYETIKTEDTWSGLYACADLLGESIYTLHSDKVFTPKVQEEHPVELKKGERFFLSEFIEGYEGVPYPKHVLMAADFEIEYGSADVDVFAARKRETGADGKPYYPDVDFENCGYGIYKRGRTHKGIADSLPASAAEVEYEITESTKDGAYIPLRIFNEYYPEGNLVTEWTTNLNPQDDMYAKNLTDGSNILPLKYVDDSKLDYYGEAVPEKMRDNVWIFDNSHSDTIEYPGEECGMLNSEYIPNYELKTDSDNTGYACSMGNYGVTLWYNLKITNNSSRTRYLDYLVNTAANVIVEVKDKDGNYLQPIISKGQTAEIKTDTMASVPLPCGEVTEFSIGMTLPVQNYGGQRQRFRISDEKTEPEFKENNQIKPIFSKNTDGIDVEKAVAKADEKTQKSFGGNEKDLTVVKTDTGYAVYYSATEGNPWYYGYYWQITGRIFILDAGFNIIKEIYPGSQPIEMSFSGGRLYVKTIANGSFVIDENYELQPFDSYILPRNSAFTEVLAKDNKVTVSKDGQNFYPVEFQKSAPLYVEKCGDLFYYAEANHAGASADGIYWQCFDGKVSQVSSKDDIFSINGGDVVFSFEKTPSVLLNKAWLGFDSPTYVKNGRIYVPMRFIFEKLGMRVMFNAESGETVVFSENALMKFKTGELLAEINGKKVSMEAGPEIYMDRMYIPLRFLIENAGYDVAWDSDTLFASINGYVGKMPGDAEILGNISAVIFEDVYTDKDSDTEKSEKSQEDNQKTEDNTADLTNNESRTDDLY